MDAQQTADNVHHRVEEGFENYPSVVAKQQAGENPTTNINMYPAGLTAL